MRWLVPLAALLALAGCGGLSAEQALVRAQERTAEIETLRFSVEGSAEGDRFAGEGAVDNRARRSQLSLRGGGRATELVLDGSVLYARLPMLGWVSADLERVGKLLGDGLGELTGLVEDGPTGVLEQLRAVGDVEELGREQVRGVETTRYRALLRPPGGTEEDALPVEVWIDDDGLVRRLRVTYGQRAASVTVELFDFGADVDVEPPPADQVTDLDELFGGEGP